MSIPSKYYTLGSEVQEYSDDPSVGISLASGQHVQVFLTLFQVGKSHPTKHFYGGIILISGSYKMIMTDFKER